MGSIGYGYGSEWHLLSYLGRHRDELNDRVKTETGSTAVEWLDFPKGGANHRRDAEWKGLDFIKDVEAQKAWSNFWPQHAGIQNWDAVARLDVDGKQREWLLVEAKAHINELESSCGAKSEGGLGTIKSALEETKLSLGVEPSNDWLAPYYQYCNRVAVLDFLRTHSISARLLFIYFTGDSAPGNQCPVDEAGWQAVLATQDKHVGLPKSHSLASRIHKLFLPAYISV